MEVSMRFLFPLMLLTGCITNKVTPLKSQGFVRLDDCQVQIFPSLEEAKSGGEIESLCMISREENINVSVAETIQRAAPAACGCGTNLVYVKSTNPPSFINNATVELVGFRYKGK